MVIKKSDLMGVNSIFIAGLFGITMLFLAISCSSVPEQSPEDIIRTFIGKHISIIDLSAADFYVKDEQPQVKELIARTIQLKKEEGVFKTLKTAKYDVSNVRVKIINQKEQYVNDEPANFVEVEAKGFYTVNNDGQEESIMEDEVFVLFQVGDEWKLTEKVNPWK